MNRKFKRVILAIIDLIVIVLTIGFSYLFLNPFVSIATSDVVYSLFLLIIGYSILACSFKIFNKINRYTSIKETFTHCGVITLDYLISSIILMLWSSISMRFLFLSYILTVIIIPSSRVVWRIMIEHRVKLEKIENNIDNKVYRTLIVGAGEGGSLFIKNLKHNPEIILVGVVDDDMNKAGTTIYGTPILGDTSEISEIVKKFGIDQITVAIPSLEPKELDRIVSHAAKANVKVNQMPSVEDIVKGTYQVNKFKEIEVSDLLGREEVKLNMEEISKQVSGKTILVSGAGGSIGSEICRQVMRFSPRKLLLLGHGENSIYLINRELKEIARKENIELIPVIADIQDRERIFKVMKENKPNIVYHAAAHKHVPLMEYNPSEAVKNNIFGTKNMAEAAKAANVENFVMVSTDKAVNPPNVMGATKRVAEMIVTGLNEKNKTKFAAVRFGNVLGSRGSVIPVFKDQIKKGGPITVTDFRMTRYFMTIPEASRLVLQAGSLAKGGEIFVLDMGEPVRIVELANKMIQLSGEKSSKVEVVESGIRPGEKLYEELLTKEELTEEKVFEKIFVGKVTNAPLEEVLIFAGKLEDLDDEELREKLIFFANNKGSFERMNKFSSGGSSLALAED
ncbi:polysaccharide biosynthesis protein [Marinilactibacillus sp. 15R]|uniref:polysaccharide biosynthesis protein n=1 Tax=Marinilactibacillus sp. 15R TaxID=1911586 RepID=UPI00090CB86E|nr:nucleoside-diphosphate sugar epimerase/dehydratase [Marinilactibacillus sp. 15R]API89847.1 polysaccharide biosynthesis protein [Marinilactibacillus sp. 15R]